MIRTCLFLLAGIYALQLSSFAATSDLLIVALIDVADTWSKSLIGLSAPPLMQYSALMLPWITMSTIAMFVRNRTYHAVFALMFFGTIVLWLTYSINGILAIVAGDA